MSTIPAIPIEKLGADIRAAHDQCNQCALSGLQHALTAGKLLLDAKERVAHGKWAAWVEENCGFSERLAQKYMQVARQLPKLDPANTPRVADLSFRGALELIGTAAKAARKVAGPDQARVLESAAERTIPNMTQATKEYVSSRQRKRRKLIAERRAETMRAQVEEAYGPLPPSDGARLCGFGRAELDVILETLDRNAHWYHDLAASRVER